MVNNYTTNIISYADFLKDIRNFKQSGGNFSSLFNKYDSPSHKYFKIFFYFHNGTDNIYNRPEELTGLLAPVWDLNILENQWYLFDNAWTYLKRNYEDERADKLKDFITLLSNISSESPWYFSEISGLDAAINRKSINEKDFKIDEQRQQISIKCLPDAFDDRIGTLLDLYRSITWSWVHKKEILPANLRKFDMGILVYESTIAPIHAKKTKNDFINDNNDYTSPLTDYDSFANISFTDHYTSNYQTSYKYYEFHNCEIDYNSSVGNLNQINNKEGFSPEYSINIFYDDCYENRYNEFFMKSIGDLIKLDLMYNKIEDYNDEIPQDVINKTISRLNYNTQDSSYNLKNALSNAWDQVKGTAIGYMESFANRALLGNLYSFSLTKINNQIDDVLRGNIMNTINSTREYINDNKQREENNINLNKFGAPIKTGINTKENIGQLYEKNNIRILPSVKKIGNIAQANTIANNI